MAVPIPYNFLIPKRKHIFGIAAAHRDSLDASAFRLRTRKFAFQVRIEN
jgi:hypothetical protein